MGDKKFLIISLGIILAISLVSAGFWDNVKVITGKASSKGTNVTIGLYGASMAKVTSVSTISAVSPTEASYRDVTFYATLYDADGVEDLNDSSVSANFSRGAEYSADNLCTWTNDIDTYSANYTCSILMWYWFDAGAWNVTVAGTDLGNLSIAQNTTTTFTYNQLKALVISPNLLTWGSIYTGSTNQQPTNDPTKVNNTGNYNSTISLTGIDLAGEVNASKVFGVANFTADETDGQACASGTALVNNSAQTITGTVANRGNLSLGTGVGQENLYYCIPTVPSLPSQTYSTLNTSAWTIAY